MERLNKQEPTPKKPGLRTRAALLLVTAASLGVSACGEVSANPGAPIGGPAQTSTETPTTLPQATDTPSSQIATPTVSDIEFPPGTWTCKKIPAYSVLQGDFFWDGRRKFDNDAKSGAVGKVFEDGTACTSFGGDVIVASPETIDQIAGQAVDEMSQSGCENNAGCPDGINVWTAGQQN